MNVSMNRSLIFSFHQLYFERLSRSAEKVILQGLVMANRPELVIEGAAAPNIRIFGAIF
jgi:hypothetical protein